MWMLVNVLAFSLIFTNIHARSYYGSSRQLSRLLKPRSLIPKGPIIILLDPHTLKKLQNSINEHSTIPVEKDRTISLEDDRTMSLEGDHTILIENERVIPLDFTGDRTMPVDKDTTILLEEDGTLHIDSVAQKDDKQPDDQEVYEMYNMLRTHPGNILTPKLAKKLEQTKQVLRQALIGRCKKLKSCRKKCPKPKVKKVTCVLMCQAEFDDMDACDEPEKEPEESSSKCDEDSCEKEKKKNKGKRGRTLPPNWL